MKKVIIMSIVSLMFTPLFAQVADGNVILGGSFAIISDGKKNDDGTNVRKEPKDFEFMFGPRVHFMITDHISVGGQLNIDMMKRTTFIYPNATDPEEEVKEKDNTTEIGIGPVARYWWQIGEKKKFGLYTQAAVGFASRGGKDETYDPIEDVVESVDFDRTNKLFFNIVPGMYYAPAECFFFEVTFGGFGLWYNYEVTNDQDSEAKVKDGYFKLGGDLDEMFFGNTAVGFNFVF